LHGRNGTNCWLAPVALMNGTRLDVGQQSI